MCMDLCMSVSEYKTATWWYLSCATFVKSFTEAPAVAAHSVTFLPSGSTQWFPDP